MRPKNQYYQKLKGQYILRLAMFLEFSILHFNMRKIQKLAIVGPYTKFEQLLPCSF